MKSLYTVSLISAMLLFACQKSNTLKPIIQTPTHPTDSLSITTPPPSYFVTCNVDGVAKSFNADAGATKTTTTWNFTILDFKGLVSLAGSETISIGIDNSLSADSIVAGTYTDTSTRFSLEAIYVSDAAVTYDAGTTLAAASGAKGAPVITNHLTTTITSISNGEIKGTFSGDFYYNNDLNGTKKSITNGTFYVKVK
jgi:hypothetical protein